MHERFSSLINSGEGAMEEIRKTFNPERLKTVVELDTLRKMVQGDPDLEQLLEDMVAQCEKYTKSVLEYRKLQLEENQRTMENREEWERLDGESHIAHDATIDSVNILARNLNQKGKNGAWVSELLGSRARYGNFAMALTFKELMKEEVYA